MTIEAMKKKVAESAKKMAGSAKRATDIHSGHIDTVIDLTHDLFLASIGGLTLAQEEIEKLVRKLIERGQIKEEDGKKYINNLMNKSKKAGKALEARVEEKFQDKIPTLELPGRKVFNDLVKKVDAISTQVDELTDAKPKKKAPTRKKRATTSKKPVAGKTRKKATETKVATRQKTVPVAKAAEEKTEVPDTAEKTA